jgi:hypothetical protein
MPHVIVKLWSNVFRNTGGQGCLREASEVAAETSP